MTLFCSAIPASAQTVVTSLSGMNGPTFLAIDPNRTIGGVTAAWLYVSEHGEINNTGGGRILRYNLTSGSTTPTVIATAGSGDGQFTSPDGIIVDASTGDLFIADRALNRIQRITNTGGYVMKWGSGTSGAADEMHGPVGIARDSSGAIYVAEHGETLSSPAGAGGSFVSKYTISGNTATRVWRRGGIGGGDGQFANTGPYGIAVSGNSLLISDSFSSRVQVWDLNGTYQSQFSIPNTLPLGLSVDSTGALWIAESSGAGDGPTQQVQKATISGSYAGVTLTDGFLLPFHAVVDTSANRAYVTDYGHDRVVVFNLASTPPPAVPVINSASAASGTVGSSFSYTITASNSPTSFAIASGSLPAGLSLSGSTISGTPTAAGSSVVGLTATNAAGTSSPFNLTITIEPSTPPVGDTVGPVITSFDLGPVTASDGAFFVTFNEAVTGVDTGDFVFNTQGNATTNITSVTAESATRYRVNFTYGGTTGSVQLAIRSSGTGIVDASNNPFVGAGYAASDVIPFTAGPPADGTAPSVASFTVGAATGSTVNFTLTFTEPVTGVDAADFVISRSGTATGTIGSVSANGAVFTIPVTFSGNGTLQLTVIAGATTNIRDSATNWFRGVGSTSSQTFTLPITGSAPVISSATSASATVGTAFTYQIVASGSPTSYAATGLAGTGLTLNTGTGAITGTPTAVGTISSSLTAVNSFGTSAPVTLNITVTSAGTAPSITSANTASATVGTAFTYQITASGSPTSYAATGLSGTGLSINTSTGVISGTPTTAGTISAQLTATNSVGTSAPATLTITVTAGGTVPTVTSAATASATVGTAFSYQITASGSPTSYAATGLTGTGLSLNATTGVISGTPTAAGTITSQLTATNSTGTSAAMTLTITVTPAGTGVPVITSAESASATVGSAFNYAISASNSPTSYAATGLTGTGLSLNATTGVISGTPTAAGTITSQLTATNSSGTSAAKTLTITVSPAGPAVPVITSAGSANASVGSAFNYAIVASNSPTSYAATGLSGTGLSLNTTSGVISGTPTSPGTIMVQLTATNATGTSTAKALTIVVSGVVNGAPVVTNANVSGSAGLPLTHQVMATNNPTSFTIVGQPPGMSINATTGMISGTPLSPGTYAATVRATNAIGTGMGTITFSIGTQNPPPQPQAQTVSFSAPVSAIIINQPVRLGATASSGLPISYTIVSGNAVVAGDMLTIKGTGPVVIRASQAGNASWAAASSQVTVTAQKAAQTISADTSVKNVRADARVTLDATASSGLPVTYTVVSGPATVSGNSLTFTGGSGTVVVRVSQAGSDAFNAANDLTLTFNVSAVGQQVYFGKIGTDDFAAVVSNDNTKGVFAMRVAATGEAYVARFNVRSDGSFSATARSVVTGTATPSERSITGTVRNGVLSGTVSGVGNFTANVQPASGSTLTYAGLYTAMMPGSASGDTYLVVGPAGQAFALVVTPTNISSGMGTVSNAGAVSVTTSGGNTVTGDVDLAKSALNGSVKIGSATSSIVGLSASATPTDRLVNISSRLRVTGGDLSRTSIAGFVITGTAPRQVLIRAVGPSLSKFGITDGLTDPTLQLYNSANTLVASNSGWNNDTAIANASTSSGAFSLNAGSRDAAILMSLAPGSYTAHVSSSNSGKVLIEVYDVAANAAVPTKLLVNISTRGFVGTGDDALFGGFVVSGNEPKRVVIRAIGPALAGYGVAGTLADPQLKVYDSKSVIIAQNDDWGTAQPLNSSQFAASAAEVTAANVAAGAFPLAAGSKDSVVVITLNPGAYTAIVTGAGTSTGNALVEVYEIPNP